MTKRWRQGGWLPAVASTHRSLLALGWRCLQPAVPPARKCPPAGSRLLLEGALLVAAIADGFHMWCGRGRRRPGAPAPRRPAAALMALNRRGGGDSKVSAGCSAHVAAVTAGNWGSQQGSRRRRAALYVRSPVLASLVRWIAAGPLGASVYRRPSSRRRRLVVRLRSPARRGSLLLLCCCLAARAKTPRRRLSRGVVQHVIALLQNVGARRPCAPGRAARRSVRNGQTDRPGSGAAAWLPAGLRRTPRPPRPTVMARFASSLLLMVLVAFVASVRTQRRRADVGRSESGDRGNRPDAAACGLGVAQRV